MPALPSACASFERARPGAFAFAIDRGPGSGPSWAGSAPVAQLVVDRDGRARAWHGGAWSDAGDDPLEAMAAFVERWDAEPVESPSWLRDEVLPRTVGYLSYELGAWTEAPSARREPGDVVGTPLAVLSTYGRIDAVDPSSGRTATLRFGDAEVAPPPPLAAPPAERWRDTARQRYEEGFARIRSAIAAGDLYQANLTRRAVLDHGGDAWAAWRRLARLQPVPWGAFLDFGGFALLSNSPECFLERRGDLVLTRPIKGTRPRAADGLLDEGLRAELAHDAKEAAEHLMIVDLERNDLGRVARTGTVEVSRFASVESFATLHHLESEVRARLRPEAGLADLLRATFPGGSITGAPKIRAIELLAEVEDAERGPYTGAIGWFHGPRRVELSVAIRTAVAAGGRLLCQVGGGIVADSDAGREWQETEVKLAAMRAAARGEAGKPAREESRQALP